MMKKALVTLLVLAAAASGAFAAVNFSGELVTGYVFQRAHDEWTNYVFGQDNKDTNSTKLTLGIAEDDGYWSIGLEGELYVDGASVIPDGQHKQNRVAGDISLDLAKMIAGSDTDWAAKLSLVANDRVVGLRAYTNKSGLNFDRVRTAEPGLWANLVLGYSDLIQVQMGGAPALVSEKNADKINGETRGDFIVSAMTVPLDGLRVSVDWAVIGDDANAGDGVFGAAADVNIGALCGLDFDLGVGVADKIYYGEGGYNVLAAQVYGGVDLFSVYGEYVLQDETSRLHFGADFSVIDDMLLNVYGGVGDLSAAADSYYVGGNVGYTLHGVTLSLNLQYASYDGAGHSYLHGSGGDKGGDIAQGAVKADGFSITPMLSVSF